VGGGNEKDDGYHESRQGVEPADTCDQSNSTAFTDEYIAGKVKAT